MIYSMWGDKIKIIGYGKATELVEYKYIDHPDFTRTIKTHKNSLKADGGIQEIDKAIKELDNV